MKVYLASHHHAKNRFWKIYEQKPNYEQIINLAQGCLLDYCPLQRLETGQMLRLQLALFPISETYCETNLRKARLFCSTLSFMFKFLLKWGASGIIVKANGFLFPKVICKFFQPTTSKLINTVRGTSVKSPRNGNF